MWPLLPGEDSRFVHAGVTLAVCSRLRGNVFIEIGLGIGDPRQAAHVIPEAPLRRAEARVRTRHDQKSRYS